MKTKFSRILTSLIILFTNTIHAQLTDGAKDKIAGLEIILKSAITYVVLEDSVTSEYNEAIKYAMDRYWKQNKIEYITDAAYKKKKLVKIPYLRLRNEDESGYTGGGNGGTYKYVSKDYIGLYYNDKKTTTIRLIII